MSMSLKRKLVEELHKPKRRNYQRSRVVIKGVLNDLWQADLVDLCLHPDKGFKYLLTVIDVGSKKAWAIPLRTKSGKEVSNAFSSIFRSSKLKPKHLQVDRGREFYNQDVLDLMREKQVNMYSSFTELKASVVERFNRTLKQWMWLEFSVQGNRRWLHLIPSLLERYNNRVHRSIGMRPADVKKKDERTILSRLFPMMSKREPKFALGDRVRVSKIKNALAKGYLPSWTNEQFIVSRIRADDQIPTYNLQDVYGNEVKGRFYEEEMKKTLFPDQYLVEKILKRKNGRVLVKWLGFDDSHNTWEDEENVEK